MTRYQLLLLPTLVAAIFALGGALDQTPPNSPSSPAVQSLPQSDPKAIEALDQAIASLAPANVSWLETKVWQQITCEEFTYQACGRLVIAPGDRIRFDLNVQVGRTLGELRMINDGEKLWQSIKVGDENAVVQHWDLPILDNSRKTPGEVVQARAKMLEDRGFAGLAPMLSALRLRMKGAQLRTRQWQGREVQVVTAAWPEGTSAPYALPDFVALRFQLRQCSIFLDAETNWPHRIEWWGSDKPNEPNQLLSQTEYRNPVLNQPMTAERCAGEFTFAN